MAKGKSKDLKPKTAVSTKSTTEAGKGKRIPTQPPGMPQGKHHVPLAKMGDCRCGSCSKELVNA